MTTRNSTKKKNSIIKQQYIRHKKILIQHLSYWSEDCLDKFFIILSVDNTGKILVFQVRGHVSLYSSWSKNDKVIP